MKVLETPLTTPEVLFSPLSQWERGMSPTSILAFSYKWIYMNETLTTYDEANFIKTKNAPLLKKQGNQVCTSSLWSTEGLSANSELGGGLRCYMYSPAYKFQNSSAEYFGTKLVLKIPFYFVVTFPELMRST